MKLRSAASLALIAASLTACPSRESVGSRSVTILGSGVVNDPKNKSLRFDLLRFGLDSFCGQMQAQGLALKMSDDEPVMGRFYATACNTQVIDEEARKSFVVQYAGTGFVTSKDGGRLGFSTTGLVEYAPDFLLKDGALYVYFRPRVVDASGFQTLLVESALANAALKLFGVDANAFGKKVVDAQLRRGLTVIRYNENGETDYGVGFIPLGQKPYHPFSVETEDKRVLLNERTEVHTAQQDFLGPFSVDADDQALYLTAKLEGTAALDVLLIPEATGRSMLNTFTRNAGPVAMSGGALLDEALPRGLLWKRFVPVPKGKYFVVLDHSGALGRTTPSPGPSGRVDVLVLLGDKP
ncbi:MAG TPA: hypothetical protein VFQ61_34150 [Polyangiaceae bacterium]|nr:hypothetical protein [Polyangiaceae bacterium]